jgi:hypothetical protein
MNEEEKHQDEEQAQLTGAEEEEEEALDDETEEAADYWDYNVETKDHTISTRDTQAGPSNRSGTS